MEATEFYQKALDTNPDDSKRGEVRERMAYALYKSAMQAGNLDEFRDRIRQATSGFERASELFGKTVASRRPVKIRCEAMSKFMGFWLATGAGEKKKFLDETWTLTKESLKGFREEGNPTEYGWTYNQLSLSATIGAEFHRDHQERAKMAWEAVEFGEESIRLLSNIGDKEELARAYVKVASFWGFLIFGLLGRDDWEKYEEKTEDYWQKATRLSEEAAFIELANPSSAYLWFAVPNWNFDFALTNLQNALEYGRKTGDNFVIGRALDWLAFSAFWKEQSIEDPDQRVGVLEKALKYAEQAKQHFSRTSFVSPRSGVLCVEEPLPEYYWELATGETDLGKKRELLEKAQMATPQLLRRASYSGYPRLEWNAHHVCAKILASLAKIETNATDKRKLLEEALEHEKTSNKYDEELEPFGYWDRGVGQNYLADIRSELADLAELPEDRKTLLRKAALDKEAGLEICLEDVRHVEKKTPAPENRALLGRWQCEFAGLLNRLNKSTAKREYLENAVAVYFEAAESFRVPGLETRIAECYWNAARTYDELSEYRKSAESFTLASEHYGAAAEKIPQLKEFYQDQLSYMKAWSEIEKAKHHHSKQEYNLAKESYEKAALLHYSTKRWKFVAPNYSAWARVEQAEDLSRTERVEEAVQAFREAAKLFQDGKSSIQAELSKIENQDEKRMATGLVKAADLRQEYCSARIAVEEARTLDMKGDHSSSSDKYEQAMRSFEKIMEAGDSEQVRREMKLIMTLSKAWQIMTRAEGEASPELYQKASRLFEEAKDLSPNEKTRMLTLGHSRFCKALEAGTRFADTRDQALHADATRHLESAANYYAKAGFQSASEYAEATDRLFDAYVHMDEAKKEKDQQKKAKLYSLAEKVLQVSADSYLKSAHPGKREEVLRLLERVKKEKQLAVSLTELLQAPSTTSTTETFHTPMPTHEKAVGIEKFEHADIQLRVIAARKSVKVGEDLDLEIEVVNAGAGPAQLMKVEDIMPEGFELAGKPEPYRIEDGFLNMKGKRLDPLKTLEVGIVLKPRTRGQFTLRPRILYLDETGKYKSHEPDPLEITVSELGITGWLKGAGSK